MFCILHCNKQETERLALGGGSASAPCGGQVHSLSLQPGPSPRRPCPPNPPGFLVCEGDF